jgi:hypothetical protein
MGLKVLKAARRTGFAPAAFSAVLLAARCRMKRMQFINGTDLIIDGGHVL